MTRPSDISTKAIACRVPMQDYIKFLTEASNKGMSISDWLLTKVYSTKSPNDEQRPSKSALAAKEKEIDKLQKQIAELTKERDELKKEKYEQIHEFSMQISSIYNYAKKYDKERTVGQFMNYIHELFPNAIFD